MSYMLLDRVNNIGLAVVGDGALAQWIKHYYETIGIGVVITAHDSILCETIDDREEPIYVIDI